MSGLMTHPFPPRQLFLSQDRALGAPGEPRGNHPDVALDQRSGPEDTESVHVTQPEVSARDAETAASPFGRTERGPVERVLAVTAAQT